MQDRKQFVVEYKSCRLDAPAGLKEMIMARPNLLVAIGLSVIPTLFGAQ
jgi:hypothetical protein